MNKAQDISRFKKDCAEWEKRFREFEELLKRSSLELGTSWDNLCKEYGHDNVADEIGHEFVAFMAEHPATAHRVSPGKPNGEHQGAVQKVLREVDQIRENMSAKHAPKHQPLSYAMLRDTIMMLLADLHWKKKFTTQSVQALLDSKKIVYDKKDVSMVLSELRNNRMILVVGTERRKKGMAMNVYRRCGK